MIFIETYKTVPIFYNLEKDYFFPLNDFKDIIGISFLSSKRTLKELRNIIDGIVLNNEFNIPYEDSKNPDIYFTLKEIIKHMQILHTNNESFSESAKLFLQECILQELILRKEIFKHINNIAEFEDIGIGVKPDIKIENVRFASESEFTKLIDFQNKQSFLERRFNQDMDDLDFLAEIHDSSKHLLQDLLDGKNKVIIYDLSGIDKQIWVHNSLLKVLSSNDYINAFYSYEYDITSDTLIDISANSYFLE